ncbi:MAG: DUF1700 domain-containing protein [Clostridia bacterium]|jgi:uncharacterized membrane protein|nr:DUF1700 domain-containing protein [Clostridia bacterium]
MTYTEWRDELKSNLLCVSESERRRVLDYYAEAYADRREAGFSEREIIEEFGAPYDAAQSMLADNQVPYAEAPADAATPPKAQTAPPVYSPPPTPPRPAITTPPQPQPAPVNDKTENNTGYVILCVILAVPVTMLILLAVITTVALCVTPILAIASGGAMIGAAAGTFIAGEVAYGFYVLGVGIAALGVGIALCPLFFKLTALIWKGFPKFFAWLKRITAAKKAGV